MQLLFQLLLVFCGIVLRVSSTSLGDNGLGCLTSAVSQLIVPIPSLLDSFSVEVTAHVQMTYLPELADPPVVTFALEKIAPEHAAPGVVGTILDSNWTVTTRLLNYDQKSIHEFYTDSSYSLAATDLCRVIITSSNPNATVCLSMTAIPLSGAGHYQGP